MTLVHAVGLGTQWHFFAQGARLLISRQSLHLYALHPQLQIGPLALLTAVPFALLGPDVGKWLACLLMATSGPLLLHVLVRWAPEVSLRRLGWAGIPFLTTWTELAVGAGHLDDVLAISLGVVSLPALRRRPLVAAGLLALAADAKPWAAGFVVLLLVLPPRRLPAAAAVWVAILGVAWIPFAYADVHTISSITHFTIANSPSSALRALGVHAPRTPAWDRSAQLILGLVLGAVAVARHRPAAALLAVVAVRLLLDPGTNVYYDGGLLAACVVYDLVVNRSEWPVVTLAAAVFVYVPHFFARVGELAGTAGLLRAAFLLAVLGLITLAPTGRPILEESSARGPGGVRDADGPCSHEPTPGSSPAATSWLGRRRSGARRRPADAT